MSSIVMQSIRPACVLEIHLVGSCGDSRTLGIRVGNVLRKLLLILLLLLVADSVPCVEQVSAYVVGNGNDNYLALEYYPSLCPIVPKEGPPYITSGFGYRIRPIRGASRHHHKIDISCEHKDDVAVIAPGAGLVISTGWERGYGNTIVIEHSPRVWTKYGHLSEILVEVLLQYCVIDCREHLVRRYLKNLHYISTLGRKKNFNHLFSNRLL